MSNRSWFYASEGKQEGPCAEAQLRNLASRGAVTPDTLVWSAGMPGWVRAGDVPDLLSTTQGLPPDEFLQRATIPGGGMQELEISLGRLARIFWLFFWRSFLGAFLIGLVLGFLIGFVMKLLGWNVDQIKPVTGIVGAVTGLIWSLVSMRMALKKQYSDFRIVLVPRDIRLN